MKILHILHEFPFPPTSGIRCDMGRRLTAFRELGHAVFAVCWASEGAGEMPSPQRRAEFSRLVDEVAILPIGVDLRSRLQRVWNMRHHPSYIAARIPHRTAREALLRRVSAFAPDLIWLEGVHPSWLAWQFRQQLGVPLVYRAHNVEHQYVAEQARLASSLRLKLALSAGTWGLEAAERRLHARADRVYDISADDLAFWRGEGFTNNEWLATQPDPEIMMTAKATNLRRDIDLLFVGSLSSPNNVAGLRWFFEEVNPAIRVALPDLKLVVAGRNPTKEMTSLAADNDVQLVANPTAVAPLFARGRVMINPILHGSGVNIKTIDMLATGCAVVTTAKGARGLPADVAAELAIADRPEAFALAAVTAVRKARAEEVRHDRAALIERWFGTGAVAQALAPFMEEGTVCCVGY